MSKVSARILGGRPALRFGEMIENRTVGTLGCGSLIDFANEVATVEHGFY